MATKQRDGKGKFVSNKNGNGDTRSGFVINDGDRIEFPAPNEEFTYSGNSDPISRMDIRRLTYNNALYTRRLLSKISQFLDGRRNIEEECGYPHTEEITAENYRDLYERNEIAAKVVNILPDECWQVFPRIFESEDMDEVTPFEEALEDIGKHLLGPGYFEDDEVNPLFQYLHRVDRLSGIGSYGALFLGVDDGKQLSEALDLDENVEVGSEASVELLFLRALDECSCSISGLVADPEDPRFGQPEYYDVSLMDPGNYRSSRGTTITGDRARVHWTRIIHIADNLMSNEILGQPRMRVVYNRLYDLHKLYGGSAEMYWKGAFPGMALQVDPRVAYQQNVREEIIFEVERIKQQLENYDNSLSRNLLLPGMVANMLSPTVVDPSPQIERMIEAICIEKDIPKRIFMGSERGELSSSQDVRTWYGKVRGRQIGHCTTRILVPVIDRFIRARILPRPAQYRAYWPDVSSLTETERADVAFKITDALVKYVQGGLESVIEIKDYLVRIHKFDETEVDQILENRLEGMEREIELKAERMELEEELLPEPDVLEVPQIPGQPSEQPGAAPKGQEQEAVPGKGQKQAGAVAAPKKDEEDEESTENIFCPTGPGGGVNPRSGGKSSMVDVGQMLGMLKESGYDVGEPVIDIKAGHTLYPVTKDGKTRMMSTRSISKLLGKGK